MAVKFNKTKGEASKGTKVDYYKFVEGENRFRLVGDILPRYVYWINNGKATMAMDCLRFDRDEEVFNNSLPDPVQEVFPEEKCKWSYVVYVFDPEDNKLKVLGLKKKLFQQIISASEDLGDPTDVDDGWMCVVKREKTGPKAFNVEYTLQALRCKKDPLTEEQKELLNTAPTLDEVFKLPSADEQRKALEVAFKPKEEEPDDDVTGELNSEVKDEDVPF